MYLRFFIWIHQLPKYQFSAVRCGKTSYIPMASFHYISLEQRDDLFTPPQLSEQIRKPSVFFLNKKVAYIFRVKIFKCDSAELVFYFRKKIIKSLSKQPGYF